jgi:hypothetical protein
MKFVTSISIQCRKSSKEHRHYITFSMIQKRKIYVVYYEQVLNDKTVETFEIATFFSEKLVRSFLNKLLYSIDNNLEKFDIEKLRLK